MGGFAAGECEAGGAMDWRPRPGRGAKVEIMGVERTNSDSTITAEVHLGGDKEANVGVTTIWTERGRNLQISTILLLRSLQIRTDSVLLTFHVKHSGPGSCEMVSRGTVGAKTAT